jgi:4-amino-4-deoxy-L-arabinose transferase-like glycosyltransferase
MSSGRAALIAALLFALSYASWEFRGTWKGPLRIDEAHKIADTFFFRLLLDGDFSHPAWSAHIVDRTNPPAGKFIYGFGAWIAGAPLAETLNVRVEEDDGKLGQQLAPGAWPKYRPTLLAMRRVSMAATALTVAILFFAAARMHGWVAGVLASASLFFAYLTNTFAATAVYDPLLTFFVAATVVPVVAIVVVGRRPPADLGGVDPASKGRPEADAPREKSRGRLEAASPRWYLPAIVAGALSALAFQTRLSGGVALLGFIAAVLSLKLEARSLKLVLAAIASFVATAFAVNPYYWRGGLFTQLGDLRALLAEQHRLEGPLAKLGFAWEIIGGDVIGLITVFGALLALLFLSPRGARDRRTLGIAVAWSLTIVILTVLWLPVAWPRYLLVCGPPLALLAGLAWAELVAQLRLHLRRSG